MARTNLAHTLPTIDPAIACAVRTWRKLAADLAPLKPAGAECKRAEDRERKARAEVGELLGASCTIDVDGETIAYERATRGGGEPDYKAAWDRVYAQLDPEWRAFMVETLDASKLPPLPVHRLTITPPAGPRALKVH